MWRYMKFISYYSYFLCHKYLHILNTFLWLDMGQLWMCTCKLKNCHLLPHAPYKKDNFHHCRVHSCYKCNKSKYIILQDSYSNMECVPQNCVTKTDNFWGSYHINICVFLTSLWIFLPCLEIIFFINPYFPVCIFKCRTSIHIYSLNLIVFWVIYLVVLFISQNHLS